MVLHFSSSTHQW